MVGDVFLDTVPFKDDVIRLRIVGLRRLVDNDVLVDKLLVEDEVVRCWSRELRRVVDNDVFVDMTTSEDGFICCWILELRRVVSTLGAGTAAIIENYSCVQLGSISSETLIKVCERRCDS